MLQNKISIGGTKGKTTILSAIEYGLLNILNDKNVLAISSTEGVFLNRALIKQAEPGDYLNIKDGNGKEIVYDYMISEAVSAQLKTGAYSDHNPQFAVYTGIEKNEHLEVHKTFEDYLRSKKILYDMLNPNALAIVNADDSYTSYIVKDSRAKVLYYGFSDNADYKIKILEIAKIEMKFSISWCGREVIIKSKLLGRFNAMNITAAFIVLNNLNIEENLIINKLSSFVGAPGRFQRIALKNNLLIVDYAHTPGSLENTLELIKNVYQNKKIVTIFGCGGGKSKEKRPLMGNVATTHSDYVIITNDNPRVEEPIDIVHDIIKGIKKNNYKVILDRKKSIRYAIKKYSNSVILIAGKGNEREITESKRFKFIQCKKCGHKTKIHLERPIPIIKAYSDVGYIESFGKQNKLLKDIRFCDYFYSTIDAILQKDVILHYYCKFEKIPKEEKYFLLLRDIKLQIDEEFYLLLCELSNNRKNLKYVFDKLSITSINKQYKYIRYLNKLNRLGAIFTLN